MPLLVTATVKNRFLLVTASIAFLFCTHDAAAAWTNVEVFPDLPEVIVRSGKLRGKRERNVSGLGVDVDTYLGVPYAKPPKFDRRFRPPEPYGYWPGPVYEAIAKPPGCYQIKDNMFPGFRGSEMWNAATMDEDCLYLNVWAPVGIQNATVMVWIYGGGYFSGTILICKMLDRF